ncbi:MAG: hypothetical protein WCJ30_15250 [Deltaproteobacteria bacterium]
MVRTSPLTIALGFASMGCAAPVVAPDSAADGFDVAADATETSVGPGDATAGPDCSRIVDASAPTDGGVLNALHGVRYCEVLLSGFRFGALVVDVYNTIGVSDCPQDAWNALDAAALRAQYGRDALLNGPRYWLIDAFERSSMIDPTVQFFGCIPMRAAGWHAATNSELAAAPYTPYTFIWGTRVLFASGSTVYELVDPTARVFDMLSYSVQLATQTESSLSTLGSRLTLPTGWSFRARTLTADLHIDTTRAWATLTADDFKNTYLLSQQ